MNSTDANARQVETFEQWWEEHRDSPGYGAMSWFQTTRAAWQAARKATLEECAEAVAEGCLGNILSWDEIAVNIRAKLSTKTRDITNG